MVSTSPPAALQPSGDVIMRYRDPVDKYYGAGCVGSNLNGSFLTPHSCANNSTYRCPNHATKICGQCGIVQYCSKECQLNDRDRHKNDCRESFLKKEEFCPATEKPEYMLPWPQDPTIAAATPREIAQALYDDATESLSASIALRNTKRLWGMTPALDILKLEANEGLGYEKELDLMFDGAEDLRDVMASLLSVPEYHKGKISCHIYEIDFDKQMRNILILMVALHFPEGQAAELITHLWYSSSIPLAMYLLVIEKILPLFQDLLTSAEARPNVPMCTVVGSSRIVLTINKAQLEEICERLDPLRFELIQEAYGNHINHMNTIEPDVARSRRDHISSLVPSHRLMERRYLQTGILLPHDAPIRPLHIPNPTFFSRSKDSPFFRRSKDAILHPLASPTDNQDLPKLRETCNRLGLPPNDIHGAIFFQTREIVTKFCARLARIEAKLVFATCGYDKRAVDAAAHNAEETDPETASEATTMTTDNAEEDYSENASEATTLTANDVPLRTTVTRFDRILSSKVMEVYDGIGVHSFEGYASSLKDPEENPHAALLLLFQTATETAAFGIKEERTMNKLKRLLPHRWHTYSGYIHAEALKNNFSTAHEMRWQMVVNANREEVGYFDIFRRDHYLDDAARASGLKIMEEDEMFIAPAWPYRLEMSGTEAQQLSQFQLRLTSRMNGGERLVEFRKNPEGRS